MKTNILLINRFYQKNSKKKYQNFWEEDIEKNVQKFIVGSFIFGENREKWTHCIMLQIAFYEKSLGCNRKNIFPRTV
jgi:hypothetical protein